MTYSIQQLATLAGVSVRTLHHYDAAGLLCPSRQAANKYRQYNEGDLLKLQQILFFRELEFSLDDIRTILSSPDFDIATALREHRVLIKAKQKRLTALIGTIDKTLTRLTTNNTMEDKELYDSFTKEEQEKLAGEAKERWGHTDAYRQSQERYAKLSKEQIDQLKVDADVLMKKIATHVSEDPNSTAVQELMEEHYNALRTYYEPTFEIYRGLAQMFIQDPRFTAYYEKYATGLAQFMHDAMIAYCVNNE
jgi:DNA-binding transcriptional MerR regulator